MEDASDLGRLWGKDAPFFLMFTPLRQPGLLSVRGLIPSASFVGCADITFSAITENSLHCTPGCLFAALPGTHTHGKKHIEQALQRGAAAILTDSPLANVPLPQCIVPDVRQVYGRLCHGLYAFPSQRLGVAGVTGTNGKTTVTWILRSLLESASYPTGVIGTIEYNDGFESQPATLTTPDALTLARTLAAIRDRLTSHVAIELSSHALKQSRTAGLTLDVGMITNITRDHQDYHLDLDDYIRAKSRIAHHIKPGGLLVLNADDPIQQKILEQLDRNVQVKTFGIDQEADIQASNLQVSRHGSRFTLAYGVEKIECTTRLVGQHNISNCLAAAAAAIHFGLTPRQIQEGLATLDSVPGRLEKVECGQNFDVYVDFAHTDDALKRTISTVRELTTGKVIVVFGAGGDRDKSKRPLMGLAATAADEVILTSDNPRSEEPIQIIHEIRAGFPESAKQPEIEIERDLAIRKAIRMARAGDAVIVAGKGHEKVQIIGDRQTPFDDAGVCQLILSSMLHGLKGMHKSPNRIRAD
ncbi:UDP-N-acetylmuramoyl-L-alanyl-D-glutamate--2,6-diaminopimelate ligase [Planctomicrobium sp. SH668]|uniref:UDP-N-acetylmuramoyl-L-alanyl-D-glutamate--2, 6-diaminopimelate ligase n=1 Tax=Planctomicrobium sp. SH668 TaxID=3448126 RepID=UPI003F5C5FF0